MRSNSIPMSSHGLRVKDAIIQSGSIKSYASTSPSTISKSASPLRQTCDRAFDTGLVLVSDATVAELMDVLQRSHFDRYVREEERLHFLAAFIRDTTLADLMFDKR